ncbi:MAG: hypothetical protein ACE5I1_05030 [bacterium]
MKKTILFLLLFTSHLFAQGSPVSDVVIPLFGPDSLADGLDKVDIDENSSATVDIIFPNRQVTNFSAINRGWHKNSASNYSGYALILADIDTTAAFTHGDGDSLSISAWPLIYNQDDSTYQEAVKWYDTNNTAQDSVIVVGDFDWETNHSDASFSFIKQFNFPPCNGIRLKIYTGFGGMLQINPFLLITK